MLLLMIYLKLLTSKLKNNPPISIIPFIPSKYFMLQIIPRYIRGIIF